LLVLRLREWYGLYYPELINSKDNEGIVNYVVEKLYRDEDSVGHEISKEDLQVIKKLADGIKELYTLKSKLDEELEKKMQQIMPNTTHLVGSSLAASLLIQAGSLEKLARFPSSTIQVLGAEKALFRYLSGKGKAPKHGVIFLSRYVQEVPIKFRGKMARKLASKISIAAKIDYFDKGKKFVADKLKEELDRELERIKSKGGKK
jgi:nucleolar protein 56